MKAITKKSKFERFLIVILLIIIAVPLSSHISYYTRKNRIINMVKNNIELLNQSVLTGKYSNAYNIKGIKDITIHKTSNGTKYIDFFCQGFGIVPSSVYYGFCYVEEDKPMAYQGTYHKLSKDGKGWSWKEPSGDNWCYTEKITNHWYYYEAGF